MRVSRVAYCFGYSLLNLTVHAAVEPGTSLPERLKLTDGQTADGDDGWSTGVLLGFRMVKMGSGWDADWT